MNLKWTVGQQIAVGYAVALAMMGLLIAFSLHNTQRFMEASRSVAHSHEVLNRLEALLSHIKDAETGQRGYIITGREAYLEPYQRAVSKISGELEALRRLTEDNPEQQRRLAEFQPQVEAKLAELRATIDMRRVRGFEAAAEVVESDQGRQIMEALRAGLRTMNDVERNLLQGRSREAEKDAHILTWTLEIGALLTLGFVVAAAIAITRALRRQIGSAIQHVQSSSAELQASAAQQASGAREQASATTEVSTTVKELLSTFRHIAGSAQQVARVADETAGAARGGTQTVERAQESIDMVRRQVDVIVNHMLDLGKRSQEIGGILDIINELAEQTNILAINATIESASAGEHGRRFAVVAEEIRKLADRVGASTKDVRTLIEEIRAAANTTIMATEDGSKAVQNSARRFAEVTDFFKRIAELTRTNLDVAREIEVSTQQQTSAVEQVSIAIQQVAQTAMQTEVSSAQTLRTSTQLIQLSRQLSTLVEPNTSVSA